MKSIKISNNEMAPLLEFYKQELKKAESRVDEIKMIVEQLSEGTSPIAEPVSKTRRGRPAKTSKLAKPIIDVTKVVEAGAPKKRGRKPNPNKIAKPAKVAKAVKPLKAAKPAKIAKAPKAPKAVKAVKAPIAPKIAKAVKTPKAAKPVKTPVVKAEKTKTVKVKKEVVAPIASEPPVISAPEN